MRNIKLLLYFVCKLIGLFRVAQWVTRRRLKILCYHGFALTDEGLFRAPMFIRPEQFVRRLETIKHYGCRVIPLADAIKMLYSGTLPERAVVITIDDGFYSFYRLAVPYLQRYAFPATVYVTSYYVEHPNPVFRLVVQYMFWKTKKLELVLKGVPWASDQVVNLGDGNQADRAMRSCIDYGEGKCTEEMRRSMCQDLGRLLETPYEDIVQSKILTLMTPDELRSLAASHVDVQLHTHRHTFPVDNESAARREIRENRIAIKQWLATEARHFCYPSGVWDKGQWAWLESMNVESSATCIPGLNSRKTPRQALRRFLDGGNVHQLEFEASLSGFVSLLRSFRIGGG